MSFNILFCLSFQVKYEVMWEAFLLQQEMLCFVFHAYSCQLYLSYIFCISKMKKVFYSFEDKSLECLRLCLRDGGVTEIIERTFIGLIHFWFQFLMCDFFLNCSPNICNYGLQITLVLIKMSCAMLPHALMLIIFSLKCSLTL